MLNEAMVGKMKDGKLFILRNGIFPLLALFFAVGLKYHYSVASNEDLAWILRPTAMLVERISGIPFEEEAGTGFINYRHRLVIAPACAGVNFFVIAFCMAAFSGLHRIERQAGKFSWLVASVAGAYLLTILVNAFRIILSIHAYDADIYSSWLTPERMHRLEGITIYFFFLCLFYSIIKKGIGCLARKADGKPRQGAEERSARTNYSRWASAGAVPLFWYGLVTLAIPLLNGAIGKNGTRFAEHGGMVISGCLIVLAVVFLLQLGWKRIKRLGGDSFGVVGINREQQ